MKRGLAEFQRDTLVVSLSWEYRVHIVLFAQEHSPCSGGSHITHRAEFPLDSDITLLRAISQPSVLAYLNPRSELGEESHAG
jgi:hypothetical protein